MLKLRRRVTIGFVVTTGVLAICGCAPTFQDARLVRPGGVEVTPSFSGVGINVEGQSEYIANTFAVQATGGVAERVNLGAAYARFENDDGDEGINAAAFGPKFGIVPDRFALAVPFSFFFGEDVEISESWAVSPTAIFTVPVSGTVDVNPSARLVIPLCGGCDTSDWLLGFYGGVGIRVHPRVNLRPEAGILVNPGEEGVIWTFGVGVSFRNR